jgi:hypothetical protein
MGLWLEAEPQTDQQGTMRPEALCQPLRSMPLQAPSCALVPDMGIWPGDLCFQIQGQGGGGAGWLDIHIFW